MLNYLIVFIVSLAATVVTMPLARILGRRMQAWDYPDELSHHSHMGHIARTGGIAITAGIFTGMVTAMVLMPDSFFSRNLAAEMLGGMAVFVVGLLDDLREIKPWLKALLLLAACLASVMVMNSVRLTGYERLDFLLAVLILMGGVNAFNLMDGMDGLAAGMAIVASLGMIVLSVKLHTQLDGSVKMIVMGAAFGFLLFNRPRALIFMGDCGSLLLGFYLTAMGLMIAGGGTRNIIPVGLVLSPFILDTGLAIVRRLLNRTDVFTGDRRHFYDLVHNFVPSVWQVDWIMWGMGLCFSFLGWAAVFLPLWGQAVLLAGSWLAFIIASVRVGMFIPMTVAEKERVEFWARED